MSPWADQVIGRAHSRLGLSSRQILAGYWRRSHDVALLQGPLMRLEHWPWVWHSRSCMELLGGSDRSPWPSCREIYRDHILLQPGPEPDEGCTVPGRDGLGLRTQARRHPQGGAASARLSGHQPEWQGAGDHRPGHWGEGVRL